MGREFLAAPQAPQAWCVSTILAANEFPVKAHQLCIWPKPIADQSCTGAHDLKHTESSSLLSHLAAQPWLAFRGSVEKRPNIAWHLRKKKSTQGYNTKAVKGKGTLELRIVCTNLNGITNGTTCPAWKSIKCRESFPLLGCLGVGVNQVANASAKIADMKLKRMPTEIQTYWVNLSLFFAAIGCYRLSTKVGSILARQLLCAAFEILL